MNNAIKTLDGRPCKDIPICHHPAIDNYVSRSVAESLPNCTDNSEIFCSKMDMRRGRWFGIKERCRVPCTKVGYKVHCGLYRTVYAMH